MHILATWMIATIYRQNSHTPRLHPQLARWLQKHIMSYCDVSISIAVQVVTKFLSSFGLHLQLLVKPPINKNLFSLKCIDMSNT